jgi:hypothetical protein
MPNVNKAVKSPLDCVRQNFLRKMVLNCAPAFVDVPKKQTQSPLQSMTLRKCVQTIEYPFAGLNSSYVFLVIALSICRCLRNAIKTAHCRFLRTQEMGFLALGDYHIKLKRFLPPFNNPLAAFRVFGHDDWQIIVILRAL